MSDANRRPIEIVESIKDESANVRQAASDLTDRIARFRTYLSKLKGRVETEVYGRHPDSDQFEEATGSPVSLGIKLHHIGQEWELSFGVDQDPEIATEWRPLVEAPLKLKMAGIKLFPDLLLAIERSQKQLTSDITKASKEFDEFAESLGMEEDLNDLVMRQRRAPKSSGEDLKETWKAAIALLAESSPALPGLMQQGSLVRVDDGRAVVRYLAQHQSHVRLLERNGKKDLIRDALSKVLGQPVGVVFEIYDPAKPALPPRELGIGQKEGT